MNKYFSVFSILCLLIFPGCSVKPLYDSAQNKKEGMHEIYVDVISERDGQKLRTYLRDTMSDMNFVFPKKYILTIKLSSDENQFVFTRDGNASREICSYNAEITLKDTKQNIILWKNISSSAEHNVSHTQGTITLSLYGRNNEALIKDLGDKIIENLKVYLSIEN